MNELLEAKRKKDDNYIIDCLINKRNYNNKQLIINEFKEYDNNVVKGLIYRNYIQDYKKAKEYFELEPDDNYALIELGTMNCYGEGIPINIEKAKEYYNLVYSKDKNNYILLNNLGAININYGGSNLKSKLLLLKSIRYKKNYFAYYNLGIIYLYENYKKAIYYFELSIREYNNYTSLYELAKLYLYGALDILKKDYNKAYLYFCKAIVDYTVKEEECNKYKTDIKSMSEFYIEYIKSEKNLIEKKYYFKNYKNNLIEILNGHCNNEYNKNTYDYCVNPDLYFYEKKRK